MLIKVIKYISCASVTLMSGACFIGAILSIIDLTAIADDIAKILGFLHHELPDAISQQNLITISKEVLDQALANQLKTNYLLSLELLAGTTFAITAICTAFDIPQVGYVLPFVSGTIALITTLAYHAAFSEILALFEGQPVLYDWINIGFIALPTLFSVIFAIIHYSTLDSITEVDIENSEESSSLSNLS